MKKVCSNAQKKSLKYFHRLSACILQIFSKCLRSIHKSAVAVRKLRFFSSVLLFFLLVSHAGSEDVVFFCLSPVCTPTPSLPLTPAGEHQRRRSVRKVESIGVASDCSQTMLAPPPPQCFVFSGRIDASGEHTSPPPPPGGILGTLSKN